MNLSGEYKVLNREYSCDTYVKAIHYVEDMWAGMVAVEAFNAKAR